MLNASGDAGRRNRSDPRGAPQAIADRRHDNRNSPQGRRHDRIADGRTCGAVDALREEAVGASREGSPRSATRSGDIPGRWRRRVSRPLLVEFATCTEVAEALVGVEVEQVWVWSSLRLVFDLNGTHVDVTNFRFADACGAIHEVRAEGESGIGRAGPCAPTPSARGGRDHRVGASAVIRGRSEPRLWTRSALRGLERRNRGEVHARLSSARVTFADAQTRNVSMLGVGTVAP